MIAREMPSPRPPSWHSGGQGTSGLAKKRLKGEQKKRTSRRCGEQFLSSYREYNKTQTQEDALEAPSSSPCPLFSSWRGRACPVDMYAHLTWQHSRLSQIQPGLPRNTRRAQPPGACVCAWAGDRESNTTACAVEGGEGLATEASVWAGGGHGRKTGYSTKV